MKMEPPGRLVEPAIDREYLEQPGDHPVDTPVVCVVTRFGLRSARHLLPTYLDYRRVVTAARMSNTPGLLRSAFLVENPTTCYSVSIWESREAIPRFGTSVPVHVEAARRVFGRVLFDKSRGPEIWSTKWQLASVTNNLNWDDLDLRQVILNMTTA